MSQLPPVLTIDGPSGAGKGTVSRIVALKLLRAQRLDTRAYFEVERQLLAQMRHPAIAQIFDAGTVTNQTRHPPFFGPTSIAIHNNGNMGRYR